ncbi:MAG: ABC transporter substrate-binding protein [Bacteroidota bacterium]|nr:ABC transporter substrate-binding protein [Bacteroidota bacterium]MDP4232207.1 ABC transporter substrate-binding protein [Bacteroidota bacterium]MDP4243612.1 ABC transporter substrate-binding protein [Bacteroidota bacterium]MDP4288735.1 ABC transporter substrate-binding protein [Bacteroidota bacterium]
MNIPRRVRFILYPSSLILLFMLGCGHTSNHPASVSNRVVEWELSDFATGLNPLNSTDANATYTEEQIYQRLIGIDVKTMKYTVPILAESMPTVSADHLQYDFTLRKDVKWADGKPLTGVDVIFSLKALKNPFNILSAQKRVYVDAVHSAELIDGDPYRVRFTFWKPYVLAIQSTFGDNLYIVPKHILDPNGLTDKYSWDDIASIVESSGNTVIDSVMLTKHKNPAMSEFAEWFAAADRQRLPQYIQGSGPYKLDVWVTQQYVRLVRNPNYVNHWGAIGDANPDTLIYKTILDFPAAVTALKARNVDLLGTIQPQYWKSIDTDKTGLARTSFPLGAFTYIGFNNKSPIFRDPGVRWAMAYMIDRKLIIDKLLFGTATMTESPITSTHPEYNHDLPLIPYDPQRAEHILDSLDWKDHDGDGIRDKVIGGKRVKFHFTFTSNAGNEIRKKVMLIFSEALRKIGVEAEVQTLDWSVYIDRLRDHQLDAHVGAWINDPFEADSYQLYHSSQARNRGSNYDSYTNPKADRIMEQIRGEFDEAKRLDLQKQLQKILYDDQANLFLWEPLNLAAWADRFDNVSWNSYRPGYNTAWWKVRGAGGGIKAEF